MLGGGSVLPATSNFDLEDTLRELEVHTEAIEKSRLSEQANSNRVKSRGESRIDRKLNHALQVYFDICEMGWHIGASYADSHF